MNFRTKIEEQAYQVDIRIGALDRVHERGVATAVMSIDASVLGRTVGIKQFSNALEVTSLGQLVKFVRYGHGERMFPLIDAPEALPSPSMAATFPALCKLLAD
jgi:hypothetical protein